MGTSSVQRFLRAASCVVWVSLASPLPALAQGASDSVDCNAAPYRFLRYSEDFVFVRNPACQTDFWDDMKYMPFGQDGERFLSLGGDLRLQLVNARYLSFGTEGGNNHNVALERIHLHANARLAPELRVFAELKSNHEQNREPRPLGVDVDRLDIHQAFIDIGTDRSGLLRLGRQELVYGSGRRIFPRNGPNVRGNFDALRGTMPVAGQRVDAIVFRPVRVDAGLFDDGTLNTQTTRRSLIGVRVLLQWAIHRRERPAARHELCNGDVLLSILSGRRGMLERDDAEPMPLDCLQRHRRRAFGVWPAPF